MSDSFMESESAESGYVTILKDLAKAVKPPTSTPPTSTKHGQLQMWGDLLIANISDLPIEMQHEARFHIDRYCY